ncbi:hypothetical protein [Selenomonas ruminantium]|uniref:hypothetical protein n=1 Tax=Selenomonas ruminantium TaxID=971 RepID=UPI0026F0B0CF|nr:hypothetical protein [Selenomonas ruminantium]
MFVIQPNPEIVALSDDEIKKRFADELLRTVSTDRFGRPDYACSDYMLDNYYDDKIRPTELSKKRSEQTPEEFRQTVADHLDYSPDLMDWIRKTGNLRPMIYEYGNQDVYEQANSYAEDYFNEVGRLTEYMTKDLATRTLQNVLEVVASPAESSEYEDMDFESLCEIFHDKVDKIDSAEEYDSVKRSVVDKISKALYINNEEEGCYFTNDIKEFALDDVKESLKSNHGLFDDKEKFFFVQTGKNGFCEATDIKDGNEFLQFVENNLNNRNTDDAFTFREGDSALRVSDYYIIPESWMKEAMQNKELRAEIESSINQPYNEEFRMAVYDAVPEAFHADEKGIVGWEHHLEQGARLAYAILMDFKAPEENLDVRTRRMNLAINIKNLSTVDLGESLKGSWAEDNNESRECFVDDLLALSVPSDIGRNDNTGYFYKERDVTQFMALCALHEKELFAIYDKLNSPESAVEVVTMYGMRDNEKIQDLVNSASQYNRASAFNYATGKTGIMRQYAISDLNVKHSRENPMVAECVVKTHGSNYDVNLRFDTFESLPKQIKNQVEQRDSSMLQNPALFMSIAIRDAQEKLKTLGISQKEVNKATMDGLAMLAQKAKGQSAGR